MGSELLSTLRQGRYRFAPLERITKADGTTIHLWSSQDALVLKMLALGLGTRMPLSPHCTHPKGHGGLKQTVACIQCRLPGYRFVLRTDVQGFYEHIDQAQLLAQLAEPIRDLTLLNYLWQAIRRTVHHGGLYLRNLDRELGALHQ